MTQYVINIGALPNDGTGDPLRTAFNETNLNFNQVFAAGPVLSNVRIANNTILTTNTNGNLVLAPNGIGVVQSNVSIVPNTSNIRNLGSGTQRWSSLYVQYANISGNLDLGGIFTVGDLVVTGNLTVTGNTIQIGNLITDAKTIQLANTASTANAANGSGMTVGSNDNIATLLYNSTGNIWNINIGMSAVGNITAPYFIGNGSQLTGVTASGVAASALTGNTLSSNVLFSSLTSVGTLANLSISGNVAGGNILTSGLISATGNITGGNISTDGALVLSNQVSYISVAGAGFVNQGGTGELQLSSVANKPVWISTNASTNRWVFGTAGNLTLPTGGTISGTGNITGGNILTGGLISATGNITGNYILGNISQASGFPATYGNANVVTLLAGFGSNTVSTTGNITGNYFIGNGSLLTSLTGANVTGTVANATSATTAGTVTGNAQANITSVGTLTSLSSSGNITGGNILTGAQVIASGVIESGTGLSTGGYLSVDGSADLHNTNIIGTLSVSLIRSDDSTIVEIQDGLTVDGDTLVTGNVTSGNVSTSGAVSATGNITTTGNVSGAYVKGNGSELTNLPAPTVTQDITSTGAMSIMTYDGVIKYVSYATVEPSSGNITGGNISATGNITAGNIRTSGIITAATGQDLLLKAVAGYNADLMSNNGNNVVYVNDTATYVQTVDGGGNVSLWTFSTSGNLSAPGNIGAVGNVTGANISTVGLVSATGNISGNNLSLAGNITSNVGFTGATITINNSPGGAEGAEVIWALPAVANTSLSGTLVQDVYANGMRFFESGGNSRGLYMDLGNVPNGSATAVGYRDIPQVSFTGNTTIATTDAGRHYYSVLSTGNVLTIANNASQSFQVGAAITIVNQGTGAITVAQGSEVTLYLAGNATPGNRTLATFGMATIMKVATNTWFINGTGVS